MSAAHTQVKNQSTTSSQLDLLFALLSHAQSATEQMSFFGTLLSKKEQQLLSTRAKVLVLLAEQHSYGSIQKRLGVSSATVAQVAKLLKDKHIEKLVKKELESRQALKRARRVFPFLAKGTE